MLGIKQLTRYSIYLYVMAIVFAGSAGEVSVKLARVIVTALLFVYLLSRRFSLIKSKYCLWGVGFLALNAIIARFAFDRGMASSYVVSLAYVVLVNVLACQFLLRNDCIEGIWQAFIAGATLKAGYAYARNGLTVFMNSRGVDGTSANTIGMYCAFAVVFCILFYWMGLRGNARHRKYRFWYMLIGGMNLIFMFLSASRKAFIFLLVPIMVLLLLNSKNIVKILRNIFYSILICCVVFVLVMKVPFLYTLVGRRIELMISGMLGGDIDASTNSRLLMIRNGLTWFKERPLFGYGMLNFKAVNNLYRRSDLYAHNNYIELLIDGGIVGTALYYSLYLMLIRWGIKLRKNNDLKTLTVLGILCSMVIGEFGLVSYFSVHYQFLLMSFYVYLAIKMKETGKKGI